MFKKTLLGLSAVALMSYGTFTAGLAAIEKGREVYASTRARVRSYFAVTVPVEVERVRYEEPAIDKIVTEEAERSGVPRDLILAVIDVESSGGKNLSRFEMKKYSEDNKVQAEFDRIMRNSSHGVMQVMGYNAPACGVRWQDLYKPLTGVRCGVKILRDCLDKASGSTANQRITAALGCYNGDPVVYPQKVKAALIDRLMNDGRVRLAMNFKQ